MSFSSFFGSGVDTSAVSSTSALKSRSFQEPTLQQSSSSIQMPFSSSTSLPQLTPDSLSLLEASEKGDVTLAKRLLAAGADPNAYKDEMKRTSLHHASSYGHAPLVRLLVESGARAEAKSAAGRTPLHEACLGGHLDVVEILAGCCEEVDDADRDRRTAAHLAALHGETECLNCVGKDNRRL